MHCCIYFYIFVISYTFYGWANPAEQMKEYFDVIVSVAKFHEVKVILLFELKPAGEVQYKFFDGLTSRPMILLCLIILDVRIIFDFMKKTSFYFSVLNSRGLEKFKLDHSRTMAVCFDCFLGGSKCCSELKFSQYCGMLWLVISRSPTRVNVSYIPFKCQFVVAESNGDEFVFTELYQYSERSRIVSSRLGNWNAKYGLNFTEDSFFTRRSDFQEEEVKIVPYVPDQSGAASSSIPDYIPSIWRSMGKRLNATSKEVSSSSDHDLSVNMNHPHGMEALPVMVKISSRLWYRTVTGDISLTRYFNPFSFSMWIATLSAIILSSFAMFFVNRCRKLINEDWNFFVLDAMYVFLQQGTQIIENSLSLFIIKTIQLFLSLFVFVFYGSVLISFVTVSIPKPPFSDLEGILENGRYNILAIAGRGRVIFEQSPGIVKQLFEKHVNPLPDSPKTFFQAFHRVCFGKNTLLTECAVKLAPKILLSLPAPCRVDSVPFTTLKRTFTIPEGNRFEEIFRVSITKLLESGAVGEIFWSRSIDLAKPTNEEKFESINLEEVSSLFVILLVGILVTVFIFAVEFGFRERN